MSAPVSGQSNTVYVLVFQLRQATLRLYHKERRVEYCMPLCNFAEKNFQSEDIYVDGQLNRLLTIAHCRERLTNFSKLFVLFRMRLGMPKLLIDLILCFLAVADVTLPLGLLCNWISGHDGLDFNNFYRNLRSTVEMPMFTFLNYRECRWRWHELLRSTTDVLRTGYRMRKSLPHGMQSFFLLSVERTEASSATTFTHVTIQFGYDVPLDQSFLVYNQVGPFNDTLWMQCGKVDWHFIDLRLQPYDFERCRFASVTSQQRDDLDAASISCQAVFIRLDGVESANCYCNLFALCVED